MNFAHTDRKEATDISEVGPKLKWNKYINVIIEREEKMVNILNISTRRKKMSLYRYAVLQSSHTPDQSSI